MLVPELHLYRILKRSLKSFSFQPSRKAHTKNFNKMLLSSSTSNKGLLPLLLLSHKIFDIWNIHPFKYSRKDKRFQLKSDLTHKRIRYKLLLSISFTFLSFLQTLHIWKAISVPQLLQCWFYILFASCGCYTIHDQLNNSRDIVAVLNGMLDFEKNQKQGNQTTPFQKINKIEINLKSFTF